MDFKEPDIDNFSKQLYEMMGDESITYDVVNFVRVLLHKKSEKVKADLLDEVERGLPAILGTNTEDYWGGFRDGQIDMIDQVKDILNDLKQTS